MDCGKVNIRDVGVHHKVLTHVCCPCLGVVLQQLGCAVTIEALRANGHQVVLVQRLDVLAHLQQPLLHTLVAVLVGWKPGLAAGLVDEVPCNDGGVLAVLAPAHQTHQHRGATTA